MTASIIECVPNFSEGRRPDVISALCESVTHISGVRLLDHHSDPDHNRTVLTFAGRPDDVAEAAFAAVRIASELIDLSLHTGVHPFIGAADVVPFVPIRGVSLQACAESARRLGERIGRELGLPVYLYEAAALRADRRRLELIRKGGYSSLAASIQSDPARQPDFGPSSLGRAGAVIVGARKPLIAFNVFLDSTDLGLAKSIAFAIRESGGGLKAVKALGLLVGGYAQVSINLVDFEQTPLDAVFRKVERVASDNRVKILRSELVGLAPMAALQEAGGRMLGLPGPLSEKILETRLAQAFPEEFTPCFSIAFRDRLSRPSSLGSGPAAAMSAAMAAALIEMSAGVAVRRERVHLPESNWPALLAEAATLREDLVRLSDGDSREVMAARSPGNAAIRDGDGSAGADPSPRGRAWAPDTQLQIARHAARLVQMADDAARQSPVSVIGEALAAVELAFTAFQIARTNAAINLAGCTDPAAQAPWLAELALLTDRIGEPRDRLRALAGHLLGWLEP